MSKEIIIVLAPDSFKESMTAKEVCVAMERGIRNASKRVQCIHVPMADGGEGTLESLVSSTRGVIYTTKVVGPLGNEVEAEYGILGNGKVAVIEMASASGIKLVPKDQRNPMITTTFGTGQLIRSCLDKKVEKILIGIGGSATNDGGAGMIQALGGKLLDGKGKNINLGGGNLNQLEKIDLSTLDARLKEVEIEVACDVCNTLCGDNGATKVFAKQKGATEEMIKILDSNLYHYAEIIKRDINKEILNEPGSGAAGGMGAGLMALLNGKLKSGIDMVISYTELESKIKYADMVWTGEGSIDYQTKYGKTPLGVAELAKKYNKPVIALTGNIGEGSDELYAMGIDAIFSILPSVMTLNEALENGMKNIEVTSENIMRIIGVK